MRWRSLLLAGTLALCGTLSGCGRSSLPDDDPSAPPSAAEWIKRLQDGDPERRLAAAFALGQMGTAGKEAIPALCMVLAHDESWPVRKQSAESLVHIDPKGEECVQALGGALRDEEAAVRAEAAKALAKLGPPARPTVDELIRLLTDDAPLVRCEAANALGAIGEDAERALEYLRDVRSNDANPAVRLAADDAIKKIRAD
jgi:HEAT repeat protein